MNRDEIRPWTLAQIYDDIGSRQDISRALNVNTYRVDSWIWKRERIGCPYPIKRVSHIDLYSMQEWKDWFAHWQSTHRKDTKWMDDAKVHGSGEAFWKYFDVED